MVDPARSDEEKRCNDLFFLYALYGSATSEKGAKGRGEPVGTAVLVSPRFTEEPVVFIKSFVPRPGTPTPPAPRENSRTFETIL